MISNENQNKYTRYGIYNKRIKRRRMHRHRKKWGICNDKTKEIVIDKKLSEKEMLVFKKKVLRHEITHAFLGESGLRECSLICDGGWANNEEMVDWFAIQSPKIFKVFQELTLLGDDK